MYDDENASFFVEALYPYSAKEGSVLTFRQGDIMEVFSPLNSGWWEAMLWRTKERGRVPSHYFRQISDDQAAKALRHMEELEAGWSLGKERCKL